MASLSRRYRATLAYDGTAYSGFQRQAGDTPTIQLAVEKALTVVTGRAAQITGAGRTDAGVHARGQVIAFDVEWFHEDGALLRALNANLPDDIALQDIVQAPGFHPRFDALSRVYGYTVIVSECRQPLWLRRAWQVTGQLNIKNLQDAAQIVVGEHDFATFGLPPKGTNTVRRVLVSDWTASAEAFGLRLVYTVEANAFLHRMVRRLVAMQVKVGRGRSTLADFEAAFKARDLSRSQGIAPPQGLVLEAVRYPPAGTL